MLCFARISTKANDSKVYHFAIHDTSYVAFSFTSFYHEPAVFETLSLLRELMYMKIQRFQVKIVSSFFNSMQVESIDIASY